MLLFNVVKTGFNFVVSAYDTIADLFHFSHEERDMVQYISDQQQRREEEKEQAQSAPEIGFLNFPSSIKHSKKRICKILQMRFCFQITFTAPCSRRRRM